MAGEEFDIDAFLSRPLTARIATNGPTVRPTWFLWEDRAFWILTGPWARLPRLVQADPAIALVVDECNLATGLVRQVIARGRAEVLPFDVPRGRRKLTRYLGASFRCEHRQIIIGCRAESASGWPLSIGDNVGWARQEWYP